MEQIFQCCLVPRLAMCVEPYLNWPLWYRAYADAQLLVHILFYIDMIFFLCYIAVFMAAFYVDPMIDTHIY